MGRYGEALADLDRALELDPGYTWVLGERSEVYRRMGRYGEALADLDRALELNPGYTWVLGERSEVYRRMGRYEEALTDLNRALEINPGNGWYHYDIALVWLCLSNEQKAFEALKTAADLFERNASTRNHGNLIVCRVAQSDFPEARRLTTAFNGLPPNPNQLAELTRDLSELAEIPGIDRSVIGELLELAMHYIPSPQGHLR
jgi:tetratricopeptide (TPR) repeat protein